MRSYIEIGEAGPYKLPLPDTIAHKLKDFFSPQIDHVSSLFYLHAHRCRGRLQLVYLPDGYGI